MPYIKQEKREVFNEGIASILDGLRQLESDDPQNDTGGCLNYVFTRILMTVYGKKYSEMAQAVSVLEMAKLEYYRKVAAPYEDQKEFENGEVETQISLQIVPPQWMTDRGAVVIDPTTLQPKK